MPSRAWCLIRPEPSLRAKCFVNGLRSLGYDARIGFPNSAKDCDVLVTWNRYGAAHERAVEVERRGGKVLVTENGYIGAGGTSPKYDLDGGMAMGHYVALARGAHNGGGEWFSNGPDRWAQLGVTLAPWRTDGDYILVCPNRSFGQPGRIQPANWEHDVCARLKRHTKRPIKLRVHPGGNKPRTPIEADLRAAWAVVIWHSTAGVHALVEGVPVLCDAPAWILKPVAGTIEQVDSPLMPDREPHFHRLAWAQWTLAEVATGVAFKGLLS